MKVTVIKQLLFYFLLYSSNSRHLKKKEAFGAIRKENQFRSRLNKNISNTQSKKVFDILINYESNAKALKSMNKLRNFKNIIKNSIGLASMGSEGFRIDFFMKKNEESQSMLRKFESLDFQLHDLQNLKNFFSGINKIVVENCSGIRISFNENGRISNSVASISEQYELLKELLEICNSWPVSVSSDFFEFIENGVFFNESFNNLTEELIQLFDKKVNITDKTWRGPLPFNSENAEEIIFKLHYFIRIIYPFSQIDASCFFPIFKPYFQTNQSQYNCLCNEIELIFKCYSDQECIEGFNKLSDFWKNNLKNFKELTRFFILEFMNFLKAEQSFLQNYFEQFKFFNLRIPTSNPGN